MESSVKEETIESTSEEVILPMTFVSLDSDISPADHTEEEVVAEGDLLLEMEIGEGEEDLCRKIKEEIKQEKALEEMAIVPVAFVSVGDSDISPVDHAEDEVIVDEGKFFLEMENDIGGEDPLNIVKHEITKQEQSGDKTDVLSEEKYTSIERLNTTSPLCMLCNVKFEPSTDPFRKKLPLMCESCYQNLKMFSRLDWSNRTCERYESCDVCISAISNSLDFTPHNCTCANLFRCDYCYVIFDRKDDITVHMRECRNEYASVTNNESQNSSLCGDVNDMASFSDNFINEENSKSNKDCVRERGKQLEPERLKKSGKKLQCEFCNKLFSYYLNFTKHLRKHTENTTKYNCDYCNKEFSRNYQLQEHVRIHMGIKPFVCSYCKMAFRRPSDLKMHIRTHIKKNTEEKRFICKYCNKRFARNHTLQCHLRSHTGDKPFVCNYCNKAYTSGKQLKVHVRTHTGEKPFSCKYCTVSFTYRNRLLRHLKTHPDAKPFICKYCRKFFWQSDDLNEHIKTHVNDKRFICKYCGNGLDDYDDFQAHVYTHTRKKQHTSTI